MKTAAIICEYNPFHNGHLHQINLIRKELKADRILCIMSGDFVERGEPAVVDKHTRAAYALNNGADVVIMLPVFASTSGADLFAYTAVHILNGLNCVDYLCFGSECSDPERLIKASEDLSSVNISSPAIKDLLSKGHTFAKARALLFPGYDDILNGPNNVLGLEYLNALKSLDSNIKPYIVRREGAGYNDTGFDGKDALPSALMIRKMLYEGQKELVGKHVPSDVFASLKENAFLSVDDLSASLNYKLLSESDFQAYLDVSEDLSNTISNTKNSFASFSSYIDVLKSKNYTYARISRALLHILLNIKGNNASRRDMLNDLECVRLLGFKKGEASSSLLKDVSERSSIRLITNVPREKDSFNKTTSQIFEEDYFAASLYNSIYSTKSGKESVNDYSRPAVIV